MENVFPRQFETSFTDQSQLSTYKMRVTEVNQYTVKRVTGLMLPCQIRHLPSILQTKEAFTLAHYPSRQIHLGC